MINLEAKGLLHNFDHISQSERFEYTECHGKIAKEVFKSLTDHDLVDEINELIQNFKDIIFP